MIFTQIVILIAILIFVFNSFPDEKTSINDVPLWKPIIAILLSLAFIFVTAAFIIIGCDTNKNTLIKHKKEIVYSIDKISKETNEMKLITLNKNKYCNMKYYNYKLIYLKKQMKKPLLFKWNFSTINTNEFKIMTDK